MTTARRRRDRRVHIRTRNDLTTEETQANSSGSKVGNPSYAKARAKMPPPPKPKAERKMPQPSRPPQNPATGHFISETPQPMEEVLEAEEVISVPDILKNPVLTPDEVGTLLRVSPSTVLKFVQDGDIPALRMHKETRLLRRDVIAFIRQLRDKEARLRRYKESQHEERLAEERSKRSSE